MNRIIIVLAAVFCCLSVSARQYELASPSGDLKVVLETDGKMAYSLLVGGEVVMKDCALSMTLADGRILGESSRVAKAREEYVEETITAPLYRQSVFATSYNRLNLRFAGGWSLEFRAYNDGVAYRFVTDFKEAFDVKDETVEYRFAEDYDMIIPYLGKGRNRYAGSFESQYTFQKVSGRPFEGQFAFTPALVDIEDKGWLLIMESDLISYPGIFLSPSEEGDGFVGVLPPVRETVNETVAGNLVADKMKPVVACNLDGKTSFPWRIIGYASDDRQLPVNNMVYQLATPCKLDDVSWITPGQSTWDWWNGCRLHGVDFRSGNNTETYMYHIDFAARYGIEYVMIDDGWYSFYEKDLLKPRADLNLPALCAYAREKGVKIILWAVGQTLLNDVDKVCEHYAEMGVAGFKVDFFEAQDQDVIKELYALAEATARHKMVIDMHGVPKPAGLMRTWPNVLNFEGVYGLEQMKWTDRDKADMPLNDVLIPYIRMACGAMDYTQGAMNNASRRDYRSIDHMAMSQGTRAHQVALYIVFDSPLAMLCDSPSNYLREDECTRFITSVPTVFDRSVVLDGKVGENIVMARQKDGAWYVGGITSWAPGKCELSCNFLGEGKWMAEIIKDGANSDLYGFDYKREILEVNPQSQLTFNMASGGGFAIIFRPEQQL